jgi:hypothetical protein
MAETVCQNGIPSDLYQGAARLNLSQGSGSQVVVVVVFFLFGSFRQMLS